MLTQVGYDGYQNQILDGGNGEPYLQFGNASTSERLPSGTPKRQRIELGREEKIIVTIQMNLRTTMVDQ